MNNICCGFGHRKLHGNMEEVNDKLYDKICCLILKEDVSVFMTGEMGEFDLCFSSAVRKAKKKYRHIKLILVQPYFSGKLNTMKEYYETFYDDVIVPHEVADCHYKAAITKRNRWIVENSAYVISCVQKDSGGAYVATSYAQKCGKVIISI